ncbi:hypothetical protein ELT49_23250 [Escherichia coli]|nr:hypothetical protein ELT49_23250 [Escherichia coli]
MPSQKFSSVITPNKSPFQGKITKARTPQGLTRDSLCPWLLFSSYVLTLPGQDYESPHPARTDAR